MKQVVQSLITGKIEVAEVALPSPQRGFVLVRNRCSAISVGTERATVEQVRKGMLSAAANRPAQILQLLKTLTTEGLAPALEKVRTRLEQPLALGYSSCGTVEEIGAGVTGFQPGDPAACAGYGYASHAEWVNVPQNLCVKIPPGVSWETAAFTTIGAIALQSCRVAGLQIGETVAVIGLGIVGQLVSQTALSSGCRVFGIDPKPERVSLAREVGVESGSSSPDTVLLLEEARRFTGGHGFDAVIVAAASSSPEPLILAGELARERGVVVIVGDVPLEALRARFYEKELQLRLARSYGPGRYDRNYEQHGIDYPFGFVRWTAQRNMAAFLQLAASGKLLLDPLITHRFPLDQAPDVYELLLGQAGGRPLGIVLRYGETAPEPTVPEPPASRKPSAMGAPAAGTVGIGVIGAGRFASGTLLPQLKRFPSVRLLHLCASRGASAQSAARRFKIPSFTTDYRRLLEDPRLQAVVIATPHHLHAEMVLEGLRNRRHLFVEKPLCLSEKELAAIDAAYRPVEDRVILDVGFNRRFCQAARKTRQWFLNRGGPLTVVYRVNAGPEATGDWHADPAVSGGRILGELGHFIDLLTFLVGSPPVQVSSSAPSVSSGQAGSETLQSVFRFQDGSLATLLYATGGGRGCPKERIELFADGSTVLIDDFRSVVAYRDHRKVLVRSLFQDKGFREELVAFISAAETGGPSPIPWPELYATTLATLRAVESLGAGRPLFVDKARDAER